MKKVVTVLVVALFMLTAANTELSAQRYEEAQYNYSDTRTGKIYQIYLKFKGYQVQVWMKEFSQANWAEYRVEETNDETITVSYNGVRYYLEIDENNPDVVVMYTADYASSFRYLKQ